MADPTTVQTFGHELVSGIAKPIIKTSEQLVVGGFTAIDPATGKVEFAESGLLQPLGFVKDASDGRKPEGLLGDAANRATIEGGIIALNRSVTGASAVTDKWKPVYATDGQTLTLTRPTGGKPIGFVWNWISSTYCDVYFFSVVDVYFQACRPTRQSRFVTSINSNALGGTSAVTLLTFVAKEHFKILSLYAQPGGYDTGIVAGSQVINFAINAVATTGGVLTLAYTSFDAATDLGTQIDATAITAANEVHAGDTVTLLMAVSGTGFTAAKQGLANIFMDIEPMIAA